jgi:threonine synthase
MRYLSTRGHPDRRRFCEILLEGLAPDGGLYLPEQYPQVDAATLARWRGLSYAELAFAILSLYIDDIPPADLKELCAKTYTAEVFGTRIVPLRELEDGVYLEALSNGPTLAFKDMAMQLLGNLFEYELPAVAKSSTSSARPAATPAAPPNTRCAARRACASS